MSQELSVLHIKLLFCLCLLKVKEVHDISTAKFVRKKPQTPWSNVLFSSMHKFYGQSKNRNIKSDFSKCNKTTENKGNNSIFKESETV